MIPRRREEKRKREERARGMKHMASDLGTLGYCIPKLMESGLISLRHSSHSVSPRNRQLEASQIHRPCAMGLVLIPTEANMERKEGGKKERRKWGKKRKGGKGEKKKKGWLRMSALRNQERMVHSTRLSELGRA